jgi:hypothetical protein
VDVAADAAEIYQSAFVQQNAAGYAVIYGDTGAAGPVIGVNHRNVPDQTGKADGNAQSQVLQGLFKRPFAASSAPTNASMFKAVYADNNFDVTTDSTKPVLGIMVGIDNVAEKCTVLVGAATNRALSALTTAEVPIPLNAWYLPTGAPLAAFADGVSSTPGLSFNDSEAGGIRWNNDAAPGKIVTTIPIPASFDSTKDATLVLIASKVGATSADVPTMGVEVFFHPVGAAYDADDNAGGTTNAMADLATKTVQALAVVVDAANIPSTAGSTLCATITITPEAGKLTTDDLVLHSVRLGGSSV